MQLFDSSGTWSNEAVKLSSEIEILICDWIIQQAKGKDFRHLSNIVLESAFAATLRARALISRQNKGNNNVLEQ